MIKRKIKFIDEVVDAVLFDGSMSSLLELQELTGVVNVNCYALGTPPDCDHVNHGCQVTVNGIRHRMTDGQYMIKTKDGRILVLDEQAFEAGTEDM